MSNGANQLNSNLIDIDYIADNWLHHFMDDPENGYLNLASQALVKNLFTACANDEKKDLWQCYENLEKHGREFGAPEEKGDIRIACARLDIRNGRLKDAQRQLESACNQYLPYQHHYTVAYWMLGIPYWLRLTPEDQFRALSIWEKSGKFFKEFAENPGFVSDVVDQENKHLWYAERWKEIEDFLRQVQKLLQVTYPGATAQPQPPMQPQPPVQPQPGSGVGPTPWPSQAPSSGSTQQPASSDASLSTTQDPNNIHQSSADGSEQPASRAKAPKIDKRRVPPGYLRTYPILPEPVSAGEFRQMISSNDGIDDRVLIERVEIDGRLFDIVGLRSGKIVQMTGSKFTYVLRVEGDSMDAYPILPGDYVLVSTRIDRNPGDIVVTQILSNQDEIEGNIKYLRSMDKNEIVLEYRSNNPKHRESDGSNKRIVLQAKDDKQIEIVGVAMARFTPSESSSELEEVDNE